MIRSKYLLAAVLAAATFTANAAPYDTTFDSVSSLKEEYGRTIITGTLVDGTPATLSVAGGSSEFNMGRCSQKYDLMLTQPGIYTLAVTLNDETTTGPSGTPIVVTRFVSCTLTRKP